MNINKKILAISALAVMLACCIYVVFGKNAETIRNGIEISLQEDFKIKESLGQVFFLEQEDNSQAVSSGVSISAMTMPCAGEITKKDILGESCLVIYCEEFENICATGDGVIENCGNGKITIRHDDGKLSSYFGAVCILAKGKRVKKGESIGYAQHEITYRLYENCVALDPLEYLS